MLPTLAQQLTLQSMPSVSHQQVRRWPSLGALNAPPKDSVRIDFSIWLIKGKNGKNILLDAGFLPDIGKSAKDFGIINYRRPDSALLKLGIAPEAITPSISSNHPLGSRQHRCGGTLP